ncbi:immunoglobulin kappa light chain-like isoform X1 [Xiphophorus maculatus]|uniref:immunoglobulin kappa light chain-like isoform X1 n=1 Tax=Xiphophorus maculatus TaxID=8083 RepID=UPI000C6C9344|nr:immunoglobulin kappa light chain-like isoform X1 [Xiphophorus maculatus]
MLTNQWQTRPLREENAKKILSIHHNNLKTMAFAHYAFFPTCLVLCLVQETHLSSYSSVHQESSFTSAHVGGKVTIRCFYKGDDSAWICWYKQSLGQKPRLISSFYSYGTKRTFYHEFQNSSRFQMDAENHTYYLTVSDLLVSNSATYYCAVNYAKVLTFVEGKTVSVRDSGFDSQASVDQPKYATVPPGGSVTLNCTVQTGSCGGEHRVYWFRNSDDSPPGLVYGHGAKSEQCETNPYRQTHTCVYDLPVENLDASHAGTYYCAVASCGHIVFGNGTTLNFSLGEENILVYLFVGFGFGSVTTALVVLLIIFVNRRKTRRHQATESRRPVAWTTITEDNHRDSGDLHYASINVESSSRSQKQRKSSQSVRLCSSVKNEK